MFKFFKIINELLLFWNVVIARWDYLPHQEINYSLYMLLMHSHVLKIEFISKIIYD